MEIIKIENISHLEKNIAWMLNKKPYTDLELRLSEKEEEKKKM